MRIVRRTDRSTVRHRASRALSVCEAGGEASITGLPNPARESGSVTEAGAGICFSIIAAGQRQEPHCKANLLPGSIYVLSPVWVARSTPAATLGRRGPSRFGPSR